jgi:hypothetical protein
MSWEPTKIIHQAIDSELDLHQLGPLVVAGPAEKKSCR